MSSKHAVVVLGGSLVAIIAGFGVYYAGNTAFAARVDLARCGWLANDTLTKECAYRVIEGEMRQSGISAALNVFVAAHDRYGTVLDRDCHAAIHRVGDTAYYELFLADPDITRYHFPPESLICQQGFFHGFFEHLIQDRPDPATIAKTCLHFRRSEVPYERGLIATTCFHAAGHGLVRAQADRLTYEEAGDAAALVEKPIRLCEEIPGASDLEKQLCKTGLFSIFIHYNRNNEYGFSSESFKLPMGSCDLLPQQWREPCDWVRALLETQLRDDYRAILGQCEQTTLARFKPCLEGMVTGLFTNGLRERAVERVLALCAEGSVASRGLTESCYTRAFIHTASTYPVGGYEFSCGRAPAAWQAL
jgi:hypothetical protein